MQEKTEVHFSQNYSQIFLRELIYLKNLWKTLSGQESVTGLPRNFLPQSIGVQDLALSDLGLRNGGKS